jgi:DNA repair exonuclease SbcCD ATPase subunit
MLWHAIPIAPSAALELMHHRGPESTGPYRSNEDFDVWIEALRIEGGVLDGFAQHFDRRLNVLIGGRGTGKSSIIQLIRFCLGATSYTESGHNEATQHALGVLGDGRVTVTLADGKQQFEVSRTAHDTEPQSSENFTPPFVFSQAEIESIGLQAQSRLRLIDAFLPPQQRVSAEVAGAAKIRSATAEIRNLLAEIDDINEKTVELPKLQAQLEETKTQTAVRGQFHKEIETHRKALTELTPILAAARVRSETIGRAADRLSAWAERLDSTLEAKPNMEPWPAEAKSADELTDLRKREKQAERQLWAGLEEIRAIASELEQKKEVSTNQRAGLENRARDIRQKIEERQKGASAIDKRISDLTQQISVLSSLVEVRKEREARVRQLTDQRSRLLAQQEKERQERTAQREQVTSRLNKALGPSIRIGVTPFSQHLEYISALTAALRGSGLRYKELSERIAETYSPQEIATLAEARDIKTISSALSITEERALRLCDALREQGGASLFSIRVEDDVQIELMDGTDFKGIDFLSMGQRCTAVLPIILNHTERIIILDQPEDHLDNAFVVGTLVKAIAARSKGTQTIVATHNPNIPVLGDAAQVLHMDSDGTLCFVRASGELTAPRVVDAITTIMEGGREAFARRAEFYAKNQPNVSKR